MIALLLAFASALVPGERLVYDVKYGPVRLGSLELRTLAPESVGGEACHHFRADLEFTRSLSWVFAARYRLEAWCRAGDMVTLRSYKRTREPNYRAEWFALYDPQLRRVVYSDGASFQLPDSARDMLTLWYWFRSRSLRPGDTVRASVHADRKDYSLLAVASGRRPVSTPAGEFDCVAVTPRTESPLGTVYISEDSERLPVIIRTRVGSLSVTAQLRAVILDRED